METRNLELAKQLRHELHQHPELSNQEAWTKQHLIDFIKAHTKLEIVDKGLWFYAICRAGKDKKNIAFRADIDALPMMENADILHASKIPGIAHKCGHDGHAASLAGFALEIDQKGAILRVCWWRVQDPSLQCLIKLTSQRLMPTSDLSKTRIYGSMRASNSMDLIA